MRPEAIAAVEEGMRRWANPSSPHAEGRAARAALEDARARIKAALGWDGELIFTSGASEALAIGLGRAKAERRLASAVEHDAVFRAAPGAAVLPVDPDGVLDRGALMRALRTGGRPVVAVQDVNSETGLFQPVDRIAQKVRQFGGILLSDCSQSAGKFRLPDADMIVVSAHKLGGPPGIGALLLRDFSLLEPSGGQEFGYRAGTENLVGALGFAAALDVSVIQPDDKRSEAEIAWIGAASRLQRAAREHGGQLVPATGNRSAYILPLAMPGMSAAAQLVRFDLAGFAVSAGSACSSGTLKQSRTLAAFGIAPEVAERTIRISFGWSTIPEEVDAFAAAWIRIANEMRDRAA